MNNIDSVKQQLQKVCNHYFLVDEINILESRNLNIQQQINVIEVIRTNNKSDFEVKNKLDKIIQTNDVYLQMLNYVKDYQTNSTHSDPESIKVSQSFTKLNITDVERSFNIFRNVYNMRSTNLTVQNINMIMFIGYNSEHFSVVQSNEQRARLVLLKSTRW